MTEYSWHISVFLHATFGLREKILKNYVRIYRSANIEHGWQLHDYFIPSLKKNFSL